MRFLLILWFVVSAAYVFGFLAGRHQVWYSIAEFSCLVLVGMMGGFFYMRRRIARELERREAEWDGSSDAYRWNSND